jgi:hypothetical protein
VDEYEPRILSIEDQDAILEAIPERERGIFLALALLGLRPGEARALDIADYANGWLIVDKAVKGSGSQAPIRGTKTGKGKRLPVREVLETWITRWVAPVARLTGAPLFVNPRTCKTLDPLGTARPVEGCGRACGPHGRGALGRHETHDGDRRFAEESQKERYRHSSAIRTHGPPAAMRASQHALVAVLLASLKSPNLSVACR